MGPSTLCTNVPKVLSREVFEKDFEGVSEEEEK
jgi:hypothetical protein